MQYTVDFQNGMYTVLLPIDQHEDRARSQARTVVNLPCADQEVEVTVLHVFADRDRAESTSVRQLVAGKRVHQLLRDNDVTVETLSRTGDPAEETLAVADEIDADVIVLGGRKRSALGSMLFGSVSQEVIINSTRPVTVTGKATEG